MRRGWTEAEVETVGRHFRAARHQHADRSRAAAAPADLGRRQQPAAIRRAVERGDGWVPFPNPAGARRRGRTPALSSIDDLARRVEALREHLTRSGAPNRSTSASLRSPTTRALVVDELHTLEELGVTWAVLHMPTVATVRGVDRCRAILADAVIGPYRESASGRSS